MTRYFYLRALREKRHMTQVQLSKASGIPQNCLSRYERNANANPPFTTVKAIAKVLDIDPSRLRFGPAPERPSRTTEDAKSRPAVSA